MSAEPQESKAHRDMSKRSSNFQAPVQASAGFYQAYDTAPQAHLSEQGLLESVLQSYSGATKDVAASLDASLGNQFAYSEVIDSSSEVARGITQRADSDSEESGDLPLPATDVKESVDEAFELLSAYLDEEVTVEERCLVEHWLASDPEIRSHYQKQLQLRQAFRVFMGEEL